MANDWEQLYQKEETPWDKGAPAPVLTFLAEQNPAWFHGRLFVPGCGTGSDALFLAAQGARVVAADLAPTALERARAKDPENRVEWRQENVFSLSEDLIGAFDCVWEHTCLCALDVEMRARYVQALRSTLKPGGGIYGVFFINPDMEPGETGPPFGISVEELVALWEGVGLKVREHWVPTVAYPGREGRELFLWASDGA